jgi:Acyl-CoA carboxylase epsilon subunit
MGRMSDGSVSRPALSVVRGAPTPEELAAVVVALAARGGQPAPAPRPRRSEWAAKSRQMRPALTAGPGAWRASGLPL